MKRSNFVPKSVMWPRAGYIRHSTCSKRENLQEFEIKVNHKGSVIISFFLFINGNQDMLQKYCNRSNDSVHKFSVIF